MVTRGCLPYIGIAIALGISAFLGAPSHIVALAFAALVLYLIWTAWRWVTHPLLKCYNCGLIDTAQSFHQLHGKGHGQLVSANGPKDENGIMYQFVYCRNCHSITTSQPGYFGNLKFTGNIDASGMVRDYNSGAISYEEMGVLAADIQIAMREDGVLPPTWQTHREREIRE